MFPVLAVTTPATFAAIGVFIATRNPLFLVGGVVAVLLRLHNANFIYRETEARRATDGLDALHAHSTLYDLRAARLKDYFPETEHGLLPEDARERIVVYASPRDPAQTEPLHVYRTYAQITASDPLILVGQSPESSGHGVRFNLLHEIGHSQYSGVEHALQERRRASRQAAVFYPLMLFAPLGWLTFVILGCCIWMSRIEQSQDYAEVSADYYALSWFKNAYGQTRVRSISRVLEQDFLKKLQNAVGENGGQAWTLRSRVRGIQKFEETFAHEASLRPRVARTTGLHRDVFSRGVEAASRLPALLPIPLIWSHPADVGQFAGGIIVLWGLTCFYWWRSVAMESKREAACSLLARIQFLVGLSTDQGLVRRMLVAATSQLDQRLERLST